MPPFRELGARSMSSLVSGGEALLYMPAWEGTPEAVKYATDILDQNNIK